MTTRLCDGCYTHLDGYDRGPLCATCANMQRVEKSVRCDRCACHTRSHCGIPALPASCPCRRTS